MLARMLVSVRGGVVLGAALGVAGCGGTARPIANGPGVVSASAIGFDRTDRPISVHFEADNPEATLSRLEYVGMAGQNWRRGRVVANAFQIPEDTQSWLLNPPTDVEFSR
jgi:hypothetical protein